MIVPDIVDHRLGVAKDLGADYTYLSKVGEDEQETVNAVYSLLGGAPDVTIDCSGAEASIRLAILVRTNLWVLLANYRAFLISSGFKQLVWSSLIAAGVAESVIQRLIYILGDRRIMFRYLEETRELPAFRNIQIGFEAHIPWARRSFPGWLKQSALQANHLNSVRCGD